MSEVVVSVKNLEKSFKGFKALDDVSFSVHKNDVFGFLGPNGAGKSTSLRCMLSLIQPDGGEIEIFGKLPPVIISEKLSDTSSNAFDRFDDSTSIPISAVCSKFFLNTFQESLLIKW